MPGTAAETAVSQMPSDEILRSAQDPGTCFRRWSCAAWGVIGWGVVDLVNQVRPDWLLTWFCYPAGRLAGWFFTTPSSLGEDRILVLHHALMDVRITEACSGFSFFLLLVLTIGWLQGAHRPGRLLPVFLLWWIPCAYVLTLVTNTGRLVLSVYGRAVCDRFLVPGMADAMHLAAGVMTFLPVLLITYLIMERNCTHAVRTT